MGLKNPFCHHKACHISHSTICVSVNTTNVQPSRYMYAWVGWVDEIYHPRIKSQIIKIYHECEGSIEKYVPRITVWHREACRGTDFLSYSHPNNGFFFLLTIRYHILFLRKCSQKFLNTLRCDML